MGRLLDRFGLDLSNLSYDFIEECSNKKVLEHILKVLRSGEEGFFPDLEAVAASQLKKVAPGSHLLREQIPISQKRDIPDDIWTEVELGFKDWERDMKEQEQVLKNLTDLKPTCLPKIRKENHIVPEGGDHKPPQPIISNESNTRCETNFPSSKIKRDEYRKWDKFDADEEIMKMNVAEERELEKQRKHRLEQKKSEKELTNAQLNLEHSSATTSDLSDEARGVLAEKARVKGNEYFMAGDTQLALAFYNESIAYKPTTLACNNRAMTYIKLNRHEKAILDCDFVLSLEHGNVKALLRRAACFKHAANWQRALKDLERVISLEPNNKTAQNEYQFVRRKLNLSDPVPKVRLKIEEAPKEPLPLLFYWPSTSSFLCYPNSMTHLMLTGSRTVTNHVPCKCSRTAARPNPLCRFCGETAIQNARKRALVRCKTNAPHLSAEEILKIARRRNTNFYVEPQKILKSIVKNPSQIVKLSANLNSNDSRSGFYPIAQLPDCSKSTFPGEPFRDQFSKEQENNWPGVHHVDLNHIAPVQNHIDLKCPSKADKLQLNSAIQASSDKPPFVSSVKLKKTDVKKSGEQTDLKITVESKDLTVKAEQTELKIPVKQMGLKMPAEVADQKISVEKADLSIAAEQTDLMTSPAQTYPKIRDEQSGLKVPVKRVDPKIQTEQADLRIPPEQTDPKIPTEQSDLSVPVKRVGQKIRNEQADLRIPIEQAGLVTPPGQTDPKIPTEQSGLKVPFKRAGQKIRIEKADLRIPVEQTDLMTPSQPPDLKIPVEQMSLKKQAEYSPNRKKQTTSKIAGALTEEMRKIALAEDAKKRGDHLSKSCIYPLSVRYYTTSINLYPQVCTLLSRAHNNIKLRNLDEAVQDCTKVLEMEPLNVTALLRRATAYIQMTDESNWTLGLDDLDKVVSLKPMDKSIQEDANNLMESIMGCKRRAPALAPRASFKNAKCLKKNSTDKATSSAKEFGVSSSNKENSGDLTRDELLKTGKLRKVLGDDNNADTSVQLKINGNTSLKDVALANSLTAATEADDNAIADNDEKLKARCDKYRKKELLDSDLSMGSNDLSYLNNSGDRIEANQSIRSSEVENEKTDTMKGNGDVMNGDKGLRKGRCDALKKRQGVKITRNFCSRWESLRKSDDDFRIRLQLLVSVPPKKLYFVIGERLDGDMLTELLECVERIAPTDPLLAAQYLNYIPTLARYQSIKLFMDPYFIQRMEKLLKKLANGDAGLELDLRRALLYEKDS